MSEQSPCDDCNDRMVKFEYDCLYNLSSEPNNILKDIKALLLVKRNEPTTTEEMLKSINLKKCEFKRDNEEALEKRKNTLLGLPCINTQPTEAKNGLPTFPRIFPGSY